MPYRVELSSLAFKDLERVPIQTRPRIHHAAGKLREEPRPRGCRKLTGEQKGYRIRVGDFCLIYDVLDDRRLVVINRILRRSETTYRRA